jgi:hypothetical protein
MHVNTIGLYSSEQLHTHALAIDTLTHIYTHKCRYGHGQCTRAKSRTKLVSTLQVHHQHAALAESIFTMVLV